MEDSRRNRGQIIAFLVARGGRVSSGNDNVFAFMYAKMSPTGTSQHSITLLRETVDAMARDGLVELERRSDGKIKAIRLKNSVELEQLDFDERGELESIEAVWLFVAELLASREAARRELKSTLAAFDDLSSETVTSEELQALQGRVQELEEELVRAQAPCTHEEEVTRLRSEIERRISSAREADRQRQEVLKEELRACRRSAQERQVQDGRRIAELESLVRMLPPHLVKMLEGMQAHIITISG